MFWVFKCSSILFLITFSSKYFTQGILPSRIQGRNSRTCFADSVGGGSIPEVTAFMDRSSSSSNFSSYFSSIIEQSYWRALLIAIFIYYCTTWEYPFWCWSMCVCFLEEGYELVCGLVYKLNFVGWTWLSQAITLQANGEISHRTPCTTVLPSSTS